MPFKIGGGGKYEWYDSSNGEYAEYGDGLVYTKTFDSKKLEDAKRQIEMYDSGFLDNTRSIHFPNYIEHDYEYAKHFVSSFKSLFHRDVDSIPLSKCGYLTEFHEKDDKSLFLSSLGYSSPGAVYLMLNDVVDLREAVFDKLNVHGLFVSVKTLIPDQVFYKNDKYVDTIWLIDRNLRARFVTMIIGGKKYGNKRM